MNRWQRYWFDDGGRDAIAVIRIAVAIAVLMTLYQVAQLPRLVAPDPIYRPVGVWMVIGRTPPPEALVDALWVIALASTLAMLAGIAARATTVVSFVSAVAIVSLAYSGTPTWSHSYNVVFLAQLALLGGRCGDALSVDAWLRARRGLPPVHVERGYQWSVRLVQLAVALMFVTACYHKLRAGGFTLAWATSDNLRHHLLARYDLVHLERPAIVEWLLADAWRYRAGALLNMLSQSAPLLAIIFVRRPVVRAAAGVLFVVECIAIDVIMNLPNPQWLPLAAVFFDWDAIFRRPLPAPRAWRPPLRIHVFVIAFALYYLATALVPKLDHRANTYPFSAFQMFAQLRAAPPWDEHRPYFMYGDHYAADRPFDPALQRYVDHTYRFMYMVIDPRRLAPRLEAIRAELGVTTLRHHLAMFLAPAYPAPARFEKRPLAITAEVTPGGVRTVLGAAGGTAVELRPQNVDTANARLLYYAAHEPAPIALAAARTGNTFTLAQPLPARAEHVVADIDGVHWLVWSRRRR